MSKKQPQAKIGAIKLTQHQKEVVALGVDTEFFKIISQSIIPKRLVRLSMTALSVAQDDKDLWYYKGEYAEAAWLVNFLKDIANKTDVDSEEDE